MKLQRAFSATRVVLILLCLMYFITYIDRVNVSTAATAFKQDFAFSNAEVGFVFSAFAYPYLAVRIIGGSLGDRFGARRTLTICGLIWAAATVLTALAQGLVTLVLAPRDAGLWRRGDVSRGDARDVELDRAVLG